MSRALVPTPAEKELFELFLKAVRNAKRDRSQLMVVVNHWAGSGKGLTVSFTFDSVGYTTEVPGEFRAGRVRRPRRRR